MTELLRCTRDSDILGMGLFEISGKVTFWSTTCRCTLLSLLVGFFEPRRLKLLDFLVFLIGRAISEAVSRRLFFSYTVNGCYSPNLSFPISYPAL